MIELSQNNDSIIIRAVDCHFTPYNESQLVFWGFKYDQGDDLFFCDASNGHYLVSKLVSYFKDAGHGVQISDSLNGILIEQEEATIALNGAMQRGRAFKDGEFDVNEAVQFRSFLDANINRPLKEHQVKAALHLLETNNGANFSVPGSGKTTVVLTAFQRLRLLGEIDSLFVVGPPACFGPWRNEYEAVLGSKPTYEILAGGDVDERHSSYFVNEKTVKDLYLTTFQTLYRDWEKVRILFSEQGLSFYLVIDEAHYIKQVDGLWANAVLNIAQVAPRRCILTGTPFPRSYADAYNLFDALWPGTSPISSQARRRIDQYIKQGQLRDAADILDDSIGGLFYRVRKNDLGLAPQEFHEPIQVEMNKYEKQVYDSVLDRINIASKSDYFRNRDILFKLRRGRMMRLRQCLSYTALLDSAVVQYEENLLEDDPSIASIIHGYDNYETPSKISELRNLVEEIRAGGNKIVIWSNFVRTLKLI